MENLKVLSLISILNEKEISEFRNYLRTELHNKDKKILKVFLGLKELVYGETTSRNIINIIKKIFYPDKIDEVYARKILSILSEHIENYLAVKSLMKNKTFRKILLLREFSDRNVVSLFENEISYLNRHYSENRFEEYDFFMNRIKLLSEEFLFYFHHNELPHNNSITCDLAETSEYLDIFIKLNAFVYESIIIHDPISDCKELYSYDKKHNIDYVLNDVKANENHFKNHERRIYIIYALAEHLRNGGKEFNLESILDLTISNINFLNQKFFDFAMFLLMGITLKEIVNKGFIFPDISFKIIKTMQECEVFKRTPAINSNIYFGVVIIALFFKDVLFAENFLKENKQKLDPIINNELDLLTKSLIAFEKGDYSNLKKELRGYKTKNFIRYIYSQTTLLKYYLISREQDNIHPLSDKIMHYVNRRKEISERTLHNIKKFLRYINLLAGLQKKKNGNTELIEYDLDNESDFFGKEWIEKKFKETIY